MSNSTLGDGNSGGDVVGPASSTDNAVARWDGATGKLLEDSVMILDDNGAITISNTLDGDLIWKFENNDNTNVANDANMQVYSGGASAGDAFYTCGIETGVEWSFGMDNSDVDAFVLSGFTDLTSNRVYRVDSVGFQFETLQGRVIARNPRAADFNMNVANEYVGVTDTTAPRTITLPVASVRDGQVFTIKDESGAAGTNNITVDTPGAETIDGLATAVISVDYGSLSFIFDGSNFFII